MKEKRTGIGAMSAVEGAIKRSPRPSPLWNCNIRQVGRRGRGGGESMPNEGC